MPSLVGYHHVSFTVTDLERSVDWYREVLGFSVDTELERPGFRRTRLRHPDTGLTLTLTQHDGGSGDSFTELRTGLDHLAFEVPGVDDIGAWKRRFEKLHVDHSEIRATPRAGAMITLRDPDNIQLEVFARAR